MNLHVDLGQIIIATLIAVVGFFIKKEITGFGKRLDKHEQAIFSMVQDITRVIAEVGIISKIIGIGPDLIDLHRVLKGRDKS